MPDKQQCKIPARGRYFTKLLADDIQASVHDITMERFHSAPGDLNDKEVGGHVGVPNKRT